MLTNDLKKGDRVRLRNGWEAEIYDNMKGNRRLAKVYGFETEIGSIYAWDIAAALRPEGEVAITLTPAQVKMQEDVQKWL